jgi:shikimate dehydrogenase
VSSPDRYAVFGNPVKHSLSPRIHAAFAVQCEQDIQYRAVQVADGEFVSATQRFFGDGGCGLNITVPFKREAWELADELSPRAQRAGAVNTMTQGDEGLLLGDNTDGVGLIRDMVANLGWTVAARRVLVLGAGGAARGVLEPLLRERPSELFLANRTASKAEQLAEEFSALGPVSGTGYEEIEGRQFDLLINATSASLGGELPPLPETLLTDRSCCYDMMYGAAPTVFMRWAAQHTAWAVADGLGMLVEQAAEAFHIWRHLRPQTGPVIAELRASLNAERA